MPEMGVNQMINKFKELNEAVLNFMTRNIAKIMGIVIVSFGLFAVFTYNSATKPETAAEFADTTVMIVNSKYTSGGSGVILESNPFGSKVLTNKHVCRLIEKGGYIIYKGFEYQINEYKKYPKHDLCLLSVIFDFGITTKVANFRPSDFSNASVSGHPGLMPPVLTKGYFSGREEIMLIVGFKKCDKDTDPKYRFYCWFFGGLPVFESFSSQLVTATILPGSSGSGVFNEDGELAGLVFAGRGRGLMYAYIVPHEYLVDFLRNEDDIEWKRAGAGHNYEQFFNRIFNFQNACDRKDRRINRICTDTDNYLIWRR